jgi:hypothetical protein
MSDTNLFAPLPVGNPIGTGNAAAPHWFAVSPLKLVLLSLCSFNLYLFYWHHQQWTHWKARGHDVMPLARAFFQIFFVTTLFREVRNEAGPESPTWSPELLGVLYVLVSVMDRISSRMDVGPLGLLAFALPFLVLPVQREINRQLREQNPEVNLNEQFSFGNIVVLGLGGLLLLLAIYGSFLPVESM